MSTTTAYRPIHSRALAAVLATVALVFVAGCGDDATQAGAGDSAAPDGPEGTTPEAVETAMEAAASATSEEEVAAAADEMAEEMAADLEEAQEARGGGGATLTVGDESWTFDSVLCALGEEETGQEGAEFVLTGIQDGVQLYVTIDDWGHSITLDDIENFEEPTVALRSADEGEFLQLDGTQVSAEMAMIDSESFDPADAVDGTLEGSCP